MRMINIVFYLIDGDEIDYFVTILFEFVVDFVFLPNSFDYHEHLTISVHFMTHYTFVMNFLDEKSFYFLRRIV